jgi:hypothetical protein
VQAGDGTVTLHPNFNYHVIIKVIMHWGCPDSELQLITVPVMEIVDDIIAQEGRYTRDDLQIISMHSDGLYLLFSHDRMTLGNSAPQDEMKV